VPSMRRRTKTMASSTNGYVGRVLGWAAATWPGKPLFFSFSVLNSIPFADFSYLNSTEIHPRYCNYYCCVLGDSIWVLTPLFINYYWNLG
jgi:hypothetical protein